MKFLAIFTLCAIFAVALSDDIPDKLRQKLRTVREKCQLNPATAINEDELRIYRESSGEGRRPENMGRHSLCMTKEMGWQNEDGTINKELLREKIRKGRSEARTEEIMDKCAVEKDSDMATAEHLIKCLMF